LLGMVAMMRVIKGREQAGAVDMIPKLMVFLPRLESIVCVCVLVRV